MDPSATAGSSPSPISEPRTDPGPATDAPTTSSGEEVEAVTREEWLKFGWMRDEAPPDLPPVIREVSIEESQQVWGDCLGTAGFPVTMDEDGQGFDSGSIPPDQAHAWDVAFYTCKAQYPLDPRVYQPYNQAQLELFYTHMVDIVAPCVAEQGYTVDQPPSMETWIAAYRSGAEGRWHPFNPIYDQNQVEIRRVEEACPLMPETMYDLASRPES